ncbi:hypothetical protein J2129_001865 [Methanofollis sp. W23]|nr:hypothetical protein [Methanofollis sp. W23]
MIAILLATVQPCLAAVLTSPKSSENNAFTLHLDAGWNLVSVPLMVENPSVEGIFGEIETLNEHPVLFWNGKEFISVDMIKPLTGYFVYTEQPRSIMIQGSKIVGITKDLKPGWNMIGGYGPTVTFDLSEIPNQVMECPSLSFDGEKYVETQLLSPGKGGWIFVEKETIIDDKIINKPIIEILSPKEDIYANEKIILGGHLENSNAEVVQIRHNGNDLTVPVSSSNFSAEIDLADVNSITIHVTENGIVYSKEILLDGDHLWDEDERKLGFDPLNPDSDCSRTEENEAGNGILDGYEILDGNLPVFAKVKVGADPFNADTNGDGLTDEFELTKLGVIPGGSSQPAPALMMLDAGAGLYEVSSGTTDDPDGDGLTNLEEQTYGTDPLKADTDDDGLNDAEEIEHGTDPLKADTDDDGLNDAAEIILGTDPLNADSNNNGIPDGYEEYLSQDSFINGTLELAVHGQGYAIGNVSVAEVNLTRLISDDVLASKVYNIEFGQNISSGELKITYDPTHVDIPDNLSIYQFDTGLGTFVPVQSVVDVSNEIVSCSATNSSKYAVFNSLKWDALFDDPAPETNTVQTASLAGPATSLSEEEYLDKDKYIPAFDDQYPLIAPPEVELVEGVDYGVIPYNESIDCPNDEENETRVDLGVEDPECLDFIGSDDPMTTSSDEVRYQAVSNGDFFKGMADWAPSNRVYESRAGYGHEIDTEDFDCASPPHCLSIFLWNNGRTKDHHNYQVAHANVDLTGVDTLTFKYKCPFFEKGKGLTASRLEFKIDGRTEFRFHKYSYPFETDWQSQAVDVSGYTGMHTIAFNGYLTYGFGTSNSNELSRVQFLIDDVSAWSIQKPAAPDTANVRFFVRDSQTNEGVPHVSVYCNNEVKRTDTSGYTNDFFLKSTSFYQYRVEAYGYKIHEGLIKVTLGDAKTAYSIINKETAPTGDIRVTSNPDHAIVYVDGLLCGGTNGWVYDLLAGSHTVEVRKEGYHPASKTVQVYDGQTTKVAFELTAETGTLEVTSSPPGARVYIDGYYKGTTSETTGLLTISDAPAGTRQVKVVKNDYAPYIATVTIEVDQTTALTATLNNDDLEEDGLLDYDETNGFLDGFGNRHTTDPFEIDTDGDGLSDGYEAGPSITIDGKTYHKQRSDPNKADTDGDGLDDWDEDYLETDPFNRDTDFDFIIDGVDDAPLTPVYISVPLNKLIEKRNATLGSVFGETGITGGSMNWIVGDDVASSPAYFIGWMASGYFAVGDLRDTLEALYQGDTVGAGLNALGIVPLAGDGERSANALRKVVTKYPGKAADLGRYLLKQDVVQRIPSESLQLFVLDRCFDGGATALRGLNVPMVRILEVGKIDGIHLARHADALEIVRGSSRMVDKEGTVAEIIAERTILNTLYPNSVYAFYSDVKLRNANNMVLGEIDTVIVRENNVVAIVQTKTGRKAADHARDQLSRDLDVIDDRYRFISTDKPDLTPAQFRVVELDTVTVGPKDGNGFDHVVEYTNRELHELYRTITG